ncbi:MAG TPA: response regulator [Rhodanobacter sp.]|nr:response regulator [Rhodanobacter sp.]
MNQPPDTAPCGSAPRVLVADDDPSSRRFLGDGLRSLGAETETCVDGETALQLVRNVHFDLLLLDCRMPAGGALHILGNLRADSQARSADAAAVATSAELETGDRQRLLTAGFSEILLKPCSLTDLQRILALARPVHAVMCVLDDHMALSSSGDITTMRALRALLREELSQLLSELDALSTDVAGFSDRLHRLRSSCGFCGATALSEQIVLLQQQLRQTGANPTALTRFRKMLETTERALEGQQPAGQG